MPAANSLRGESRLPDGLYRRIKGHSGGYRYQIGGLRLIYEVHEDLLEVRVYSIRPRGDVYKH